MGSPGGSLLDIGVGAAGLSVAMARLWPSLTVVVIDPWEPSLALARENVQSAGLTDRIELREQAAEDVSDTDAFDLAWIPSAFIPETVIFAACETVYRALRPGGWLLFAMASPGTDPVTASLVRLRTVFWGGCLMTYDQIETLLKECGFTDVRTLPAAKPNQSAGQAESRERRSPSAAGDDLGGHGGVEDGNHHRSGSVLHL
ncbi:MAG: class I SAM-dependent methyltransferase [Cytophagales bacterium]|nr:class I SAM-dependent methyltransferase [Armatimonadota bacterium]